MFLFYSKHLLNFNLLIKLGGAGIQDLKGLSIAKCLDGININKLRYSVVILSLTGFLSGAAGCLTCSGSSLDFERPISCRSHREMARTSPTRLIIPMSATWRKMANTGATRAINDSAAIVLILSIFWNKLRTPHKPGTLAWIPGSLKCPGRKHRIVDNPRPYDTGVSVQNDPKRVVRHC